MKVKGKGYDIKAQGNNTTAEIWVYGDIGAGFFNDGIDAKMFAEDLNSLPDAVGIIELRLNSAGGSVFDGLAMFNSLLKHPARVEVSIDGMAFSIASVIAMAGDSIVIAETAQMMIHNPSTSVRGDSKQMRKVADLMDNTKETLITAYKRHVDKSDEELSAMMDETTFFKADEAVNAGFATEVFKAEKIAAHYDGIGVEAYDYKNQPEVVEAVADVPHETPAPVVDKAEPKEETAEAEPADSTRAVNIVEEEKKLLALME